jgi:hypothetical protein
MSLLRTVVALGVMLCGLTPAMAAEQVGEAVRIKTEVTGEAGELSVKSPIHRDERIRTSKSGLGQFVFRDGTKLAIGWGSSVVVDKFVFDDSKSVKKFTVKATKGTFRWISGDSKSSAYEIVTPAGTIGVRGTVFDFYVGTDGTTAVVLLSGSARFCGAGGCKELKRRCDCVVAKRGRGASDTKRVDRNIFKMLGNQRAFPFLSGNQRLSGTFGMLGSHCGLASTSLGTKEGARQERRARDTSPDPDPPDKPGGRSKPDKPDRPSGPSTPDTPSEPSAPDTPSQPSAPDTPSQPSTPDTPSQPNTPDTPSDPGTPSEPGTPDPPGEPGTPSEPDTPDPPGEPGSPNESGDRESGPGEGSGSHGDGGGRG